MKYWLVSGVCGLLFTVLLLILAEMSTRFFYRDIYYTAAGKDYFYYRAEGLFATEKHVGPLWSRGYQYKSIKSPGVYRIVVLGDSLSWGQSVFPHTRRYSEILENRIREIATSSKGKISKIEIINLGTRGSDLQHHIERLSYVAELNPDFILYQWYVNDMDVYALREPSFWKTIPKDLFAGRPGHSFLKQNSVLYFLLNRAYLIHFPDPKTLSYMAYLRTKYLKHRVLSKQLTYKLELFLDTLDSSQIPHGIVLFPMWYGEFSKDNYPLQFLHDMVNLRCSSRGITCLDLTSTYLKYEHDVKQLWANEFDPHPGELAHEIAATEIERVFARLWLVGQID